MTEQTYHEKMARLATEHYKDHQLVDHPDDPREIGVQFRAPWMLQHQGKHGFSARVAIEPVSFRRLLIHGDCEPMVFGGYTTENPKYHPIVDLIGSREWRYMDYVLGKATPRPENYYDKDRAEAQLEELARERRDEWKECHDEQYDPEKDEDFLLRYAGLRDRIQCGDWAAVHTYLYEEFDVEGEDVSRFGKVLAPPNFYYVVAAVKRLWELLEDQP